MMERRALGSTGLQVSVLGFGCGAVGGLMVRGTPQDQERAVARALDFGINYFDTAVLYGNGDSERNLGRALAQLKPRDVIVGTKVWVREREAIGREIARSLDESLRRLGMERVDLFQLHNPIREHAGPDELQPSQVRDEVLPALERARAQGKIGHVGFTALGDTVALQQVLPAFESAQISYNLLNPSAGRRVPADYPAQDYANLLGAARAAGTGSIGIRVLAGGALSGEETRHPLGMQQVEPIGSATTYGGDVARARQFGDLVQAGHAHSLIEAALRYAISHSDLSCTLVGLSTIGQLEYAAESVLRGPLAPAALQAIQNVQQGFAGEPR